mmetsp:Transcript_45488/g.111530  ORF Transcript_45488/g.111530 Transcript_45488/m.111530 type:complete len:146 (+) Transcript_45488:1-438(+)
MFGPGEGDGGNAVSGSTGIVVSCAGHPQREGLWHYHHPTIGCTQVDNNTLVGWALDGFPIYGPVDGSKEDAVQTKYSTNATAETMMMEYLDIATTCEPGSKWTKHWRTTMDTITPTTGNTFSGATRAKMRPRQLVTLSSPMAAAR